MMKIKLLSIALLCTASVYGAHAQTPVEPSEPMINQYVDDPYSSRSRTWWKALEKQLLLTLEEPTTEIDETTLQNVVYFASNHSAKLNLSGAAPHLLRIYQEHPDDGYRVMALSGLHVVGDGASMRALRRHLKTEDSALVRRTAVAVLYHYYAPMERIR